MTPKAISDVNRSERMIEDLRRIALTGESARGIAERAADELERLLVDAERLHDAIDALGTAPILSKYHGKNGFEVERFINDYAIWKTEVAAPATAPKQVADSSGRAEET